VELPVRLVSAAPPHEPVISVDGIVRPAVLELSHWPGNRTPRALRHDLSTGCALAFARLAPGERARLAAGARAIANNHYDTDGCLALFAVRRPELALSLAEPMLRAAAAGDFFRAPDRASLALDALVTEVEASSSSPIARELGPLAGHARWQRAAEFVLERLPDWLRGDIDGLAHLWRPRVEALEPERAQLERAPRVEHALGDLCAFRVPRAARAPGRHALFGASARDRVLFLGQRDGGTLARFVISTLSWFDLETPALRPSAPRPLVAALAERLNELEGTRASDALAWRAQGDGNAAPELWFGGAEHAPYAEWNDAIAPSRLPDAVVLDAVRTALAAVPAGRQL